MTYSKKFTWPMRVYYEDTDAGGIVYHTSYLRFMEQARTEWFRSLGIEQDELITRQHIIFAVHSLSIRYKKPAKFNQLLHIVNNISECRKVSITFNQVIHYENTPLVECTVKIVSLNTETLRPTHLPQSLFTEFRE